MFSVTSLHEDIICLSLTYYLPDDAKIELFNCPDCSSYASLAQHYVLYDVCCHDNKLEL